MLCFGGLVDVIWFDLLFDVWFCLFVIVDYLVCVLLILIFV